MDVVIVEEKIDGESLSRNVDDIVISQQKKALKRPSIILEPKIIMKFPTQ